LKRNLLLIKLAGMAVIPLVLIVLPATFFDKGQSVCLSVLLADTTCPGCGITRAMQHFLHFDFAAAYHFNKMSVIIFPLLVYLWIKEFFIVLKKYKTLKAEKTTF
jgi:hypothetical protein